MLLGSDRKVQKGWGKDASHKCHTCAGEGMLCEGYHGTEKEVEVKKKGSEVESASFLQQE